MILCPLHHGLEPKLKTLKLPAGMGREQPTAIPAVSPEPDTPVQDRAVDNMQALDVDFKGAKNMLERLRRIGRAAEGHYLSLGDHDSLLGADADGQRVDQKPENLHPDLHCQAPRALRAGGLWPLPLPRHSQVTVGLDAGWLCYRGSGSSLGRAPLKDGWGLDDNYIQ